METAPANLTKKVIGPLDRSMLNLGAPRDGAVSARTMAGNRVDPGRAEFAAKEIYGKLRKTDHITRKRDFYSSLKDEASAAGREVPAAESRRIELILEDPRLKNDEALRVELWRRLNALCIDFDEGMPAEDKAGFRQLITNARDEDEVVDVDRKWMSWCIDRRGEGCVSHVVEGHEYFAYFAGKLKSKDEKCLEEDWYWAYLFHMVNQSARIRMWVQMSLRKAVRGR